MVNSIIIHTQTHEKKTNSGKRLKWIACLQFINRKSSQLRVDIVNSFEGGFVAFNFFFYISFNKIENQSIAPVNTNVIAAQRTD